MSSTASTSNWPIWSSVAVAFAFTSILKAGVVTKVNSNRPLISTSGPRVSSPCNIRRSPDWMVTGPIKINPFPGSVANNPACGLSGSVTWPASSFVWKLFSVTGAE